MEPGVPLSLAAQLNRSTPYAPKDIGEATRFAAPVHGAYPGAGTCRSPSHSSETTSNSPSIVYVPTVRETGAAELPEYQLRVLEDGTAGLAVYTSIDVLQECLGVDQPWSEASLLELLFLVGRERIGVTLNPRMDPELVQGRESQPEALS